MGTFVLSILLFNTVGIVAIALGMALAYCSPERRAPHTWVLTDVAALPLVE